TRTEARVMSKATKAAATFLDRMKSQGKDGKAMPKVFHSFFSAVGGEEEFGQRMAKEFDKAHGIGLSPEEAEEFHVSPKLKMQWYELLSRHIAKNDESMSLDIGSL